MSREDQSLRVRWTEELRLPVIASLLSGAAVSPFGSSPAGDGSLVDLRGIKITDPVRDVALHNLDLTAAAFADFGQFINVTAQNSLFDRADPRANISGDFLRCSFLATNLSGTTFHSGRFDECSFESANLRKAGGNRLSFIACSFAAATMRGAHFLKCVFERCDWTNCKFHHSSLGGSRITRSGFPVSSGDKASGALLPDVILTGVDWIDSEK